MAQESYLHPTEPSSDKLRATANATAEYIHCVPSILTFIASRQQGTLGTLPAEVLLPAATLLKSYVEEGTPVNK